MVFVLVPDRSVLTQTFEQSLVFKVLSCFNGVLQKVAVSLLRRETNVTSPNMDSVDPSLRTQLT